MKYVVINSMSRNGTSLLYQLLLGHPELSFYPSRIEFACSSPRGWPFYNETDEDANEYVQKMISKHFNDIGTAWNNIVHTSLHNDKSFNTQDFINNFLTFNNNSNDRKQFFNSFIKSYYKGKNCEYGEITVLQEDHLFNFSPKDFVETLDDVLFIQTIRNLRDVVASRKNMLLFHNKFQGDPKLKTLNPNVVKEEATRWIWSLIASYLSHQNYKENYLVVKFETLKQNPLNDMKKVAEYIDIKFEDILTQETRENKNLENGNGLTMVDSSLKYVTKNKHKRTINSFEISLNEEELSLLKEIEDEYNLHELYNSDEDNFMKNLFIFIENNFEKFEKNHHLSKWIKDYKNEKFNDIMDSYSLLNHGQEQASNSFKEGF